MFGKDQCTTVQWHVDDLKISYRNKLAVESVLKKLSAQYGKITPLTINRGKVHGYLGMCTNYSEEDKVIIPQYDCINKILKSLTEDMKGTAVQPAQNHLFTVNEIATKLDETNSDPFHHYTAQLLFISK